jgi:hypothetical protein
MVAKELVLESEASDGGTLMFLLQFTHIACVGYSVACLYGAVGSPQQGPTGMKRNVSSLFSNEFGSGGDSLPPPPRPSEFAPRPSVGGEGSGGVSSAAFRRGASFEDTCLKETSRAPGHNTIGMIAWKITLYTPQYPQSVGGRDIVVIANDITHQGGSFGTKEDKLFQLASQYARERGLPRVYLAANCGARIGLADEVCVSLYPSRFSLVIHRYCHPTRGRSSSICSRLRGSIHPILPKGTSTCISRRRITRKRTSTVP